MELYLCSLEVKPGTLSEERTQCKVLMVLEKKHRRINLYLRTIQQKKSIKLSSMEFNILVTWHNVVTVINLLNPTGYVMDQQFNIQQLYIPPTLYLFVLYLSENKQRLVPLTA